MAAAILVACPECEKQVKVPEEVVGKRVRCKGCGEAFTVRAPGGKAAAKAPAAKGKAKADKPAPAKEPAATKGEEEEDSNPYGLTHLETGVRCPHCAQEMGEKDVVCLNCGYNTQTRSRSETKRTVTNTGTDQFMYLLPGFACCLGILALIGFDVWFWFGLASTWEGMDHSMENRSFSMGIRTWIVIMSLFGIYKLGRFAVNRLIINPVRPEREKF